MWQPCHCCVTSVLHIVPSRVGIKQTVAGWLDGWKYGGRERKKGGRERGERKRGREGGRRNNGWTRQADEWMMNYPALQIKKLRPREEK